MIETISAHVFGSDADLGLQGLKTSRIAFNFVCKVKSNFMIAINAKLLESFNIWVDILVTRWAHQCWSALDSYESFG